MLAGPTFQLRSIPIGLIQAPSRFADSATKLTPQLTLSGHGVNYKVQIHVRDMEVNHPSGNGRPIRWQWKRGQYLFAARYNPV